MQGVPEPLLLVLSPSRFLALLLLLLHLGAFLALSVVDSPWLLPLSLLLLISLFFYRHQLACCASLSCLHERQWLLTDRAGRGQRVQLVGGVMLGRLLLLNFSTAQGTKRTLFLCSDSADAGSLRRLRVRLTLLKSSL